MPYVRCEKIPGFTYSHNSLDLWSSQLIILNVFKYKVLRFLQFCCKLNTCEIVKTCPFHFLSDYCGDSLDVMFPQFPNHFLPLPRVFPNVSPNASTISFGVSTVSPQCPPPPFPILGFVVFFFFHMSTVVWASFLPLPF